jgi:hypothetical protein
VVVIGFSQLAEWDGAQLPLWMNDLVEASAGRPPVRYIRWLLANLEHWL